MLLDYTINYGEPSKNNARK